MDFHIKFDILFCTSSVVTMAWHIVWFGAEFDGTIYEQSNWKQYVLSNLYFEHVFLILSKELRRMYKEKYELGDDYGTKTLRKYYKTKGDLVARICMQNAEKLYESSYSDETLRSLLKEVQNYALEMKKQGQQVHELDPFYSIWCYNCSSYYNESAREKYGAICSLIRDWMDWHDIDDNTGLLFPEDYGIKISQI